MKFALRDDDLNYFFNPTEIQNSYTNIWDVCPVSMSIIPFVKGFWPSRVSEMEKRGPGTMTLFDTDVVLNDNKIYPIGDNHYLVDFIKMKLAENKIYLTIHAIHHRNDDQIIPQLHNNFGIGAEFYTNRDLTLPLTKSIEYLERTFNQKIEVFTPPQNLISSRGYNAILSNNLKICIQPPISRKKIQNNVRLIGLLNFLKIGSFKFFVNNILNKKIPYPYPIKYKKLNIIDHIKLQPSSNVDEIYDCIDVLHHLNGNIVLSTHSYAFDYKMKNTNKTMGQTLEDIIEYAFKKDNIKFLTLNKIFE